MRIMKKLRVRVSKIFASAAMTAALFFLGVLLVGAGAVGRLWCAMYIAGHKSQQLITEGPYSMSRNPLYFFSLLGSVGVGLCTETLCVPLLIAGAFAVYYPLVIRGEERRLEAKHGGAFAAYRARTPAFVPKASLLMEPERFVVHPRMYRLALVQTPWFVWLIGVLELFEELQRWDALPTLFHLY